MTEFFERLRTVAPELFDVWLSRYELKDTERFVEVVIDAALASAFKDKYKNLLEQTYFEIYNIQKPVRFVLKPAFDFLKFENFVVNKHNELAYKVIKNIADTPSIVKDPVLLVAYKGHGKTHLIRALVNSLNANIYKIYYVDCGRALLDFFSAMRSNSMLDWMSAISAYNFVIIEDIQEIIGKRKTQKFIEYLYRLCFDMSFQLILTSGVDVKDMFVINQAIESRLLASKVVITPYDKECIREIIKQRYSIKDNDVIDMLFNVAKDGDMRKVDALVKQCLLRYGNVLLDGIDTVIKEFECININVDKDRLLRMICQFYRIGKVIDDKKARQVAVYLLKRAGLSYRAIAKELEYNSEQAVAYAYKIVQKSNKLLSDASKIWSSC